VHFSVNFHFSEAAVFVLMRSQPHFSAGKVELMKTLYNLINYQGLNADKVAEIHEKGRWVRIPRGPAAVMEEFTSGMPLSYWEGRSEC
jgi:hypothetical protein